MKTNGGKKDRLAIGDKLRMAVIGCGRIGVLHARAIAECSQAVLAAVCDSNSERAQTAAQQYSVKAYEDSRELFSSERLDAVTIATPDDHHLEATLQAIAAGCHVFCEKPLGRNLDEVGRMVEAAASRGVHLAVDYNRRFGFGYRKAKELLTEGRIGEIEHIVAHVTDRTPAPERAKDRYFILTSLLTHHIDLFRYFCGDIRSVHACFHVSSAHDLVRNAVLSFQFVNDGVGAIVAGYRDNQTRTSERLEISGAKRMIAIEDVTRRVLLSATDPDRIECFQPNHFQDGNGFYDSIIRHVRCFIERIAAGDAPPVTGDDGLYSMRIVAAAIESHQQAKPIEV